MKEFGKILGLTLGFGILAALLASIPSRPVAQAAGAAPVLVTNTTAAQAVPVSQTGTWNVGITGTPTVGLANGSTVGINNTATSPVLVRDVDNAARHAIQVFGSIDFSASNALQMFTTLTTVPMDKGLVIEYVAVRCEAQAANPLVHLLASLTTPNATYPLPLTSEGAFGPAGTLVFSASLPTRIYVGQGGLVRAELRRDTNGGQPLTDGVFILSGYLVDCGVGAGCPLP